MILGTIQAPHKLAPDELIDRDGVYDLSMERYHGQPCARPSISTSGLKKMWPPGSPAHFFDTSPLNPQRREEEDDRPHFSVGRAAHHLTFLGREGFDREFVVRPEKWKDWRTDASQEWRAIQRRAGLTIITQAELESIVGMARALGAHPLVRAGILDGAVERSLIFRSRETGLFYKSRPDNITMSSGDFADLKCMASVSTEALERAIGDFGYHMQGGLVAKAAERCLGVEMRSFSLVCVEKTPPYCVEVVTIDPEDIVRGRLQVEAMMRVFAQCIETGEWPGPGGGGEDAKIIRLTEWKRRAIDAHLELLKQTAPYKPHPLAAE